MDIDSTLRAARREAREYKKHLKHITAAVRVYVAALDRVMATPHSHGRDQEIARLTNSLELENDMARHFGLGASLMAGKRAKNKKAQD